MRTSQFVPVLDSVVDVSAVEAAQEELRRCVSVPAERLPEVTSRLKIPSALAGADPDAWPRLPGPTWLAEAHIEALLEAFTFAVERQWVDAAGAAGTTLEAMEMWAEYDLMRDDLTEGELDELDWSARKYGFLPVVAELGAVRLDLLDAARDDPGVVSGVLARSMEHAERLARFHVAWSKTAHGEA